MFGGLPLPDPVSEEERFCAIRVVNLATGAQEAFPKFDSGVQEIFAVQALPGILFPTVLDENDPLVNNAVALSAEAVAQAR